MRILRKMRIPCCGFLVLACAAAAADWRSAPFPNWNEDTVQRILTDSPWTRPRTIKLEWVNPRDKTITYRDIPGADPLARPNYGPLGGIGGGKGTSLPDRAEILVRWVSALPVRQATALYKQRDAPQVESPESDYVLELYGVPAELAHGGTGLVETLARDSAWLRLRTGRTIRAKSVHAALQGATLSIRIHFPRTPPITPADGEMEVFTDVKIFSIKEKFKLSPMVYQGQLEI